jgi:hypothetical protein
MGNARRPTIRGMRTTEHTRGRLFVIRMIDTGDDGSLRGQVRDGVTGAYRAFTTWPELTSFLTEQLATRSFDQEDMP